MKAKTPVDSGYATIHRRRAYIRLVPRLKDEAGKSLLGGFKASGLTPLLSLNSSMSAQNLVREAAGFVSHSWRWAVNRASDWIGENPVQVGPSAFRIIITAKAKTGYFVDPVKKEIIIRRGTKLDTVLWTIEGVDLAWKTWEQEALQAAINKIEHEALPAEELLPLLADFRAAAAKIMGGEA